MSDLSLNTPGKKKKATGVPFKKRSELGGALDPRINAGGRAKILKEETAKWLEKKDGNGVTNAAKMVRSLGALAQQQLPHSVAAFKELRHTADEEPEEGKAAQNFSLTVIAALQRVARGEVVDAEFKKLEDEK